MYETPSRRLPLTQAEDGMSHRMGGALPSATQVFDGAESIRALSGPTSFKSPTLPRITYLIAMGY